MRSGNFRFAMRPSRARVGLAQAATVLGSKGIGAVAAGAAASGAVGHRGTCDTVHCDQARQDRTPLHRGARGKASSGRGVGRGGGAGRTPILREFGRAQLRQPDHLPPGRAEAASHEKYWVGPGLFHLFGKDEIGQVTLEVPVPRTRKERGPFERDQGQVHRQNGRAVRRVHNRGCCFRFTKTLRPSSAG